MKNQQLFIFVIVSLFLRNLFPFADLFLITLVLLYLLYQDTRDITSLIALIASFIYSFLADSPIGLFPLLLAVHVLLFSVVHQKFAGKGITPLLIWLTFIALFITSETVIRLLLTTGNVAFPSEVLYKIIGSIGIVTITIFGLSFKRKL